jgi:ribonuclease HI
MLTIYTDGACKGNPGPGGWGVVLQGTEWVTEYGGREEATTNNRMELMAAIEALTQVQRDPTISKTVCLCSDSKYVVQGIQDWISGWKRKGWRNAAGKPVANQDLWQRLDLLTACASITWKYVPAHTGIPGNERADSIASAFASGQTPSLYAGPFSAYAIGL